MVNVGPYNNSTRILKLLTAAARSKAASIFANATSSADAPRRFARSPACWMRSRSRCRRIL